MPLFDLIRDEKVTIWHRYKVQIEAETEAEAVKILANDGDGPDRWDSHPQMEHMEGPESLYDSEWPVDAAPSSPSVVIYREGIEENDEEVEHELYSNDPAQFAVGDTVEVPEPNFTDLHQHSFVGRIAYFRVANAVVEDGDGNAFEIEISRLLKVND